MSATKQRIPSREAAAVAKRFWERVDRSGPVPEGRPDLGNCWIWLGSRNSDGYGHCRVKGRLMGAHQVAFTIEGGTLLPGLEVCHRCDRRDCVRPDHLFQATHLENIRDMHAKGRAYKASGDANGSRLYPERRPRGDSHPARLHPERMARGDRNGARTKPETRARGEKNGAARLTVQKVRLIRERWAVGDVSQRALGREFGVSKTAIRDVLAQRTWASS